MVVLYIVGLHVFFSSGLSLNVSSV